MRYRRAVDWDLNQLSGYETVEQLGGDTSKMSTLYWGLAGSESAALGAVSAVGAQVYSFGQFNADGSPFTAIMAIDGSNLTNLTTGPRASRSTTGAFCGQPTERPLAPSVRNTPVGDPYE